MNTRLIQKLVAQRIKDLPNFRAEQWTTQNLNYKPAPYASNSGNGVWYRLTLQTATNRMSGMANAPLTREFGAIAAQVFGAKSEGEAQVVQAADALAKHLAYYTVDKLEILTPTVTLVGFDGDWYQVNVRAPYRYN